MSYNRLKIIEGDTAEIVEGKANQFLKKEEVGHVVNLHLREKESSNGYTCFINYKKRIKRRPIEDDLDDE